MSSIPDGLLYTKDDEWIKVEGDTATIGITDYAQDSLSDIVYLELPAVGDSFTQTQTFGVVESVKAAADLYMPVDGEISAINAALIDTPDTINSDPYGDAWMVRIKLTAPDQLADLLSPQAYREFVASRD